MNGRVATVDPPSSSVMTAILELYQDSPAQFEQFVRWVSRTGRPKFGTVALTFGEGKVVLVEKRETRR